MVQDEKDQESTKKINLQAALHEKSTERQSH